MKLTNNIPLIGIFTVSSGAAFAPKPYQGAKTLATIHQKRHSNNFGPSMMTLFMSDKKNDKFEKQVGDIKEKVDETTKFLVVDINKTQEQLAKNWGWITTSGVLTMALGALALILPIAATGVAYDGTVITIGAAGVVSVLNAFVRENGHKAMSALSGILYMALAYYLSTHPAQGLDFITLTIAATITVEGLYETTFAIRNKNLQARPWHFVSGIGSVLAGAWLTTSIPVASLFAPGAALGTRLTSNGASKVAIGLAGKELADNNRT